jgi:hypothetical protein
MALARDYTAAMATLANATTAPEISAPGKLYPHAQYYFFAAMVVTWIGFSRSYFLRLGSVSVFHHIHGAIAGLWIASLIVQPVLYQRGYMQLHRRIGTIAAYVLAPLMVVFASIVMHLMFSGSTGMPRMPGYVLGYLDLCSLIEFPLFVFLAVHYRRNVALHARWIAGTVLILLPPALVRITLMLPFIHSFPARLNLSFGVIDVILVLLILDDRRLGRIRAPYPVMLLMVLGIQASMGFAAGWQWWRSTADWWGGI